MTFLRLLSVAMLFWLSAQILRAATLSSATTPELTSAQRVLTLRGDPSRPVELLADPQGVGIRGPKLDAFLRRLDLPAGLRHPGFVPPTPPAPSRYAALDDVAAVPFLNDEQRASDREFLPLPKPRVFLVGRRVALVSQGGLNPVARGYQSCRRHGVECRPHAFDNHVVWPETSAAAQ